jgi:hypothetical protein
MMIKPGPRVFVAAMLAAAAPAWASASADAATSRAADTAAVPGWLGSVH